MKVLRHFPIIPRIRNMFRCKAIAELMTWHITRTGLRMMYLESQYIRRHGNTLKKPIVPSKTSHATYGLAWQWMVLTHLAYEAPHGAHGMCV